jgi:hypothetical protein
MLTYGVWLFLYTAMQPVISSWFILAGKNKSFHLTSGSSTVKRRLAEPPSRLVSRACSIWKRTLPIRRTIQK